MFRDSVIAFAFSFSVLSMFCLEIVEIDISHSIYFQNEYYLGNDQNGCFLFLMWVFSINSHAL